MVRRTLIALLLAAFAIVGVGSTAFAGANPGQDTGQVGGKGGQRTAAALACGTSTTAVRTISGIGQLVVTYNSCNGYNSARMNHIDNTYGQVAWTTVSLVKVDRAGNWLSNPVTDSGWYRLYAGPVSVYAPANCVRAQGSITWYGAQYNVDTGPVGCSGAP